MELIKLHPPFTHFAIAMPVALFVLHMYYRLINREADKLHLLFTLLATLSVLSAIVSGGVAHEPIEDRLYQIPVFKVNSWSKKDIYPNANSWSSSYVFTGLSWRKHSL